MVWTSPPPTHGAQREDEPGVKTKAETEARRSASELQYLCADLRRVCARLPEKWEERSRMHISQSEEIFKFTVHFCQAAESVSDKLH